MSATHPSTDMPPTDTLNLLAIDTVSEACSVALSLRGVVTQRFEVAPNGHSKRVLGMAEALLREAGLALPELDALAVDVGPGSFTGVRIGLGVAQGLAYGAGLEVIAVGSLEALARAAHHQHGHEYILAAIDARMQQIYYGLYRNPPGGELEAIVQPALISPQDLDIGDIDAVVTQREMIGVGSGWDQYAPVLLESLRPATNGAVVKWLAGCYPEATTVARMAAARGLQSAVSPLRLTASYIRDQVAKPSKKL